MTLLKALFLSLVALVLASSCASGWKSLFRDEGVPLLDFRASDGNYFPESIKVFFEGNDYYAKHYPYLVDAKKGIRLVQVKQLNEELGKSSLNESNLSWSADGMYLSYETIGDRDRRIQVKNLAGDYTRDLFVVSKGSNSFLNGMVNRYVHSYNSGLSWSRGSTQFAFMSNGGVGEYNIYVGAVGVKEEPIMRSPSKDGYANWNPKTDEIAFVSARSGNGDIYLLDVKKERLSRLTKGGAVDLFPQWFPNGQGLVYCSGNASSHNIKVLARNNAGRWVKHYKVTNWSRDDLRPTISPDGKLLAFYSSAASVGLNKPTSWNIHVVPLREKAYSARALNSMIVARNVVVDLNTGPAWAPDGRKIFYVKNDSKEFNPIYGYNLFTGRTYKLKTGTRMNRDLLISKLGILSFRAQVGVWDRVFVALTNQGLQLQGLNKYLDSRIHYETF